MHQFRRKYLRLWGVQVFIPPIWSCYCTESVHQVYSCSGGASSCTGLLHFPVPWQLAYYGPRLNWGTMFAALFLPSRLGLVVNWEKSRLDPSQWVQFIGISLDAITGRAFLLAERTKSIKTMVVWCMREHWQPVKAVQQLLRLMALTAAVIPLAKSHMQNLQIWFVKKYDPNKQPHQHFFQYLGWWLGLCSGGEMMLTCSQGPSLVSGFPRSL